jgi:hypothetical protein
MNRNTSKPNKPSHGIFHVTGDGKQARWTKIGAAWGHNDSSGMNLAFEYLPAGTQGRIVIRKAKDADNHTQDGEE